SRRTAVENLAAGRYELPRIAGGVEGQGEHAVIAGVRRLQGGRVGAQRIQALATGPDHELANPARRRVPGRILLLVVLVQVVVSVENDVRTGVVERGPEREHTWGALRPARREQRVMPHREHARF